MFTGIVACPGVFVFPLAENPATWLGILLLWKPHLRTDVVALSLAFNV